MNISDYKQGIVLITVIGGQGLPEDIIGRKKFISTGVEKGELGLSWLEEESLGAAKESLKTGEFSLVEVSDSGGSGKAARLAISPYLPPPQLYIMGGGHIALPLSKICKLIGYSVTILDDRLQFASPERFSEAERVVCCSFSDISNRIKTTCNDSVIIATRGHRHDLDCLRHFIKKPLAYLGMIGSRRRTAMVREILLSEGCKSKDLEKVHMPIGMEIAAQTPEEIAVSIAAELICEKRKKRKLQTEGESALMTISRGVEDFSPENMEIFLKLSEAAKKGISAALVTITTTKGSTPRKAGAKMLVYPDGRILGSVGGGCSEGEVIKEAMIAIDKQCIRFYRVEMTEDEAAQEGMVCGGVAEFIIEPAAMFSDLFE